jgi:LAO/AO transport system kinase
MVSDRGVSPEDALTRLPEALGPLVSDFREGRRTALARAVSLVENEGPGFQALLHALTEGGSASAARVGVTGPPGAGKSTLVSAMAELLRAGGEHVGILAVDPSSSRTGGAFLGDRIRMNELGRDPGIFIRSMASRGSRGGLGAASQEVLDLMDAFGFSWLLVESVGTGQIEADIADATDTTILVLVPESGDAVQAMKAGIMEIADVFVVNKADRPGAQPLAMELESMLALRSSDGATEGTGAGWLPPVLLTDARAGKGVDALLEAVEDHRAHLLAAGEIEMRRRRRAAARLRTVLERELSRRLATRLASDGVEADAVGRMLEGRATPYSLAREILARIGAEADGGSRSGDNPPG